MTHVHQTVSHVSRTPYVVRAILGTMDGTVHSVLSIVIVVLQIVFALHVTRGILEQHVPTTVPLDVNTTIVKR